MENCTRSEIFSTSSNVNTRNTQDHENTSGTKSQKVTKTPKGLKGSKRQQEQLKERKLPKEKLPISSGEEEKNDEQIEKIAFRESVQKKLKEMEEDFQRKQNKTYEERLNQLNQDIIDVRQGSSPVLKKELQKFINKYNEELEEAQMKRDYYLKCIQKEYEEETQIVENYYLVRKRKEIDAALVGDIEARKKMLLEDIKTYDQINVQDGELKGHVYVILVLRSKTKTTLNSDAQEKKITNLKDFDKATKKMDQHYPEFRDTSLTNHN
ncbi:9589_t:CDS:2 [Diversispora eburnea]|uniref:9589_t:CDS:1 n=1 Tax=Diversispora eburnea TaxID=1213867 RepID=A0A9N9BSX7_9GLOM|nr:9589_t:CDS:2 [Diversispora eburnea]